MKIVLAIAALVLTLTACGTSAADEPAGSPSPEVTSEPPAEPEAERPPVLDGRAEEKKFMKISHHDPEPETALTPAPVEAEPDVCIPDPNYGCHGPGFDEEVAALNEELEEGQ